MTTFEPLALCPMVPRWLELRALSPRWSVWLHMTKYLDLTPAVSRVPLTRRLPLGFAVLLNGWPIAAGGLVLLPEAAPAAWLQTITGMSDDIADTALRLAGRGFGVYFTEPSLAAATLCLPRVRGADRIARRLGFDARTKRVSGAAAHYRAKEGRIR